MKQHRRLRRMERYLERYHGTGTGGLEDASDWVPLPWQEAPLQDTSPLVLLDGSAGGGKSDCWAHMVHRYLLQFPGAFGLLVRKTRASMTAGAALMYDSEIIGNAGRHVSSRSMFVYHNGSILAYGGMKDSTERTRLRSVGRKGNVDILVMEEASEFVNEDFEELALRCRGTVGDFVQMLVATNPGPPTHWIYQRLILGNEATGRYTSSAADNPYLSPQYAEFLGKLTGTQRKRMVEGKWVAAEGIVHDEWDEEVHLIERHEMPGAVEVNGRWEPPPDWRRIGAIDFGWENPCVAQWWALDGDGRMYRYREIYMSHLHVDDFAQQIRDLSGDEYVEWYWDHAAGVRLKGLYGSPAQKEMAPGLLAVNGRLKVAGDGRPRMYLLRDSLVKLDERMADRHKPTCTEEEFAEYVWAKDDVPVKEGDHGLDCVRYACMAADRPRPFIV